MTTPSDKHPEQTSMACKETAVAANGPRCDADWTTATVKATVKVYGTTSETVQEIDVPLSALLNGPAPAPFDTGHSWPICRTCGKRHDSNGIPCPAWMPPRGVCSTPLRAECPTCDRLQFVWTDGEGYYCGFDGTYLGTAGSVSFR